MASYNAPTPSTSAPPQQPPKRKSRKPAGPPAWPIYSFEERSDGLAGPAAQLFYVRNPDDADILVKHLRGPLGFDLEWKPTFQKNQTPNRTAVVQLADQDHALVIQVSCMRAFPDGLREILEDPNIVKLGVNIREDALKLYHDYGVCCKHLIDLSVLAHLVDGPRWTGKSNLGLAVLCDVYLQRSLPKGPVRTSNWELVPLSATQQYYAANDAHCAVSIYSRVASIEANLETPPGRHTYAIHIDHHLLQEIEERREERRRQAEARRLARLEFEAHERRSAEANGDADTGSPTSPPAAQSNGPEPNAGWRGRGRRGGTTHNITEHHVEQTFGGPRTQTEGRGRGRGRHGRGNFSGQSRGRGLPREPFAMRQANAESSEP